MQCQRRAARVASSLAPPLCICTCARVFTAAAPRRAAVHTSQGFYGPLVAIHVAAVETATVGCIARLIIGFLRRVDR